MPRLLDQVREAIRVRHYSIRTEDSYVNWVRQFILFHGKKHPLEMAEPEVNAFLTHLAVERLAVGRHRRTRSRPAEQPTSSMMNSAR